MARQRTRFSLVEYGKPKDLVQAIDTETQTGRAEARRILSEAGNRIAGNLGFKNSPIQLKSAGVKAVDFAGLVRLSPSMELEVAPKFLGLDDSDTSWREDFFFLSTLSRHGRLLASESLSATGGSPQNLATLVARSMAGMYQASMRRPLRSYRRVKESSFFLDGDPDPIDLVFPTPDGFKQETVIYDRNNCWNADLMAAAKTLLPEINDPSTTGHLIRLIQDLTPQRYGRNHGKPIPGRHRTWKPLHDLALDVLNGLGVSFEQGHARAPGYLVSTWRVWEDFMTVVSRLAFGRSVVASQQGFDFGNRIKVGSSTKKRKLSVFPDCTINGKGSCPDFLLDAKYKGHIEKETLRISEADIYEAYAFAKAANCPLVVLAYPSIPKDKVLPVGTCVPFERIECDGVTITGGQVESRYISKVGALTKCADTFRESLTQMLTELIRDQSHVQ